MKISDQDKRKIREWEAFRARDYRDAGGKLTLGVGHLPTKGEPPGCGKVSGVSRDWNKKERR